MPTVLCLSGPTTGYVRLKVFSGAGFIHPVLVVNLGPKNFELEYNATVRNT